MGDVWCVGFCVEGCWCWGCVGEYGGWFVVWVYFVCGVEWLCVDSEG